MNYLLIKQDRYGNMLNDNVKHNTRDIFFTNDYKNVDINNPGKIWIKGSNNGTWGYGMTGGLFPTDMSGPFGSRGYPIPINVDYPALLYGNPNYNSMVRNAPAYNEDSFNKISGYTKPGDYGFSFDDSNFQNAQR